MFSTTDPYGPMSGRNLVPMVGGLEVEEGSEGDSYHPALGLSQQTYHSYCDVHCHTRHRRLDRPDHH